jgi:60 kDa SS-A/Ro ribonucleoprotein
MSTAYAKKAKAIGDAKRGIVTTHQSGQAFEVNDPREMLRRFLILGTTGGSFYVGEDKLTDEGIAAVSKALDEMGAAAVAEIVDVSREGKAAKLDPGLLAYAMASVHPNIDVRKTVYRQDNFDAMLRTASQLFSFMSFRRQLGGSSAGLRRALQRWYEGRKPSDLVYQMIKYRERVGFTHADVLRMARPKAADDAHNALYKWAVDGDLPEVVESDEWRNQLAAFEHAKTASLEETVRLITDYRLPREAVRTDLLKEAAIWEALLQEMPINAMVRNLGNMSKSGLLGRASDATKLVIQRLSDQERIRKSRIHPMALFIGSRTYEAGAGVRGSGEWKVNGWLVDALDTAYRLSFKNVEPSGKRLLIAVDSSGSMQSGVVHGASGVAVAEAAGALAQILHLTEPMSETVAIDTSAHQFAISERQRVNDVARMITQLGGGGTDLSLGYAIAAKGGHDAVVIITDSEQGIGRRMVSEYDAFMANPEHRTITVQLEMNRYSAVEDNRQSLRLVGLDPNVPRLASSFAAGTL